MKMFLSLLLVVLAILGIFDASYLTYEKLTGNIPPCGAGFDCGEVLSSQWASIGPIPLSMFGFFFYSSMFILAIINFLEIDLFDHIITTKKLLLLLGSFGFFFSLYLVSLMAFIIQAWCLYCLFSALISTSLFVTSVALNNLPPSTPSK
ncbi:MAG TPA: vitamin K epoxide reductase family protein [Patescibacteria group bacterium]